MIERPRGGERAILVNVTLSAPATPCDREEFAELAAERGLPWSIVDCRAPGALLRERIAQRERIGRDPSEADVGVLERLASFDESLSPDEVLGWLGRLRGE